MENTLGHVSSNNSFNRLGDTEFQGEVVRLCCNQCLSNEMDTGSNKLKG